MKYFIRGKQSVTLSPNDFIAKGGEGQIYGKGDRVFKIYISLSAMIPEAKIRELQVLALPNILKPEDVLLDKKNRPVGFSMKWVRDTLPLCKFFTNDFRNRNGVTAASVLELVENLKDTIAYIHSGNCLIVDGNEFNYLVDKKDRVSPYLIDTDSYQTPTYPATAIMPSIRDWHSKGFSPLTEWFSFAIIACQLFVGIHPYKGRHPAFKKNDLETRMKANVSIFNPQVKTPPAVRDFGIIPNHYMDWFIALFEKGERMPPPALPGQVMILPQMLRSIQSGTGLEIEELGKYDEIILWHRYYAGMRIICTGEHIFVDNKEYPVSPGTEILFSQKKMIPVFARVEKGHLKLYSDTAYELPFPDLRADDIMVIANTLYSRYLGDLTEISFDDMGKKVVPNIRNVWNIMPHSAEVFDGIICQSVLGQPWLVIPLPADGENSSCIVKAVPELEGYRIIEAKHEGGVCMFIGHKENRYDRILLRFDKKYENYDVRVTADADLHTPNFAKLDKGIVVSLHEEDQLEIFSAQPFRPEKKKISHPDTDQRMRLCREGNSLMFFREKQLYGLRMGGN